MKRWLILLALIATPARAETVSDALSAWDSCLVKYAVKWARVNEPLDILIDAVMGECGNQQVRWQYLHEVDLLPLPVERIVSSQELIRRDKRASVLALLFVTKHGLDE